MICIANAQQLRGISRQFRRDIISHESKTTYVSRKDAEIAKGKTQIRPGFLVALGGLARGDLGSGRRPGWGNLRCQLATTMSIKSRVMQHQDVRRGQVPPNIDRPTRVSLHIDGDHDFVAWKCLHTGIVYWNSMFSRDHEQTGLIIDDCLGLCSPAEGQKAEASIADNNRAAECYSQVQTALAFLSYLPAEPCPEYLAELTIQRWRRLTASGVSADGLRSRVLRSNSPAWFRPTAAITALAASIAISVSVLISSLGSTSPYGPRRVPPEYLEKTSGNAGLFDSNHVQLPLWDEWLVTEFMPQAPDTFPGASGSAGYSPRWKDQSMELGPRVLPASSKRHVGPSSQ